MSTPVPLSYSPAAARRRWWRLAWHAALLAAVLGAGLTVFKYRDEFRLRARRMYWGRRCLNYQMPTDAVLYEPDPERARCLLDRSADYVDIAWPCDEGPHVAFMPRCLREYDTQDSWYDAERPYLKLFRSPRDAPVCFLGRRVSCRRTERLIVIHGSSVDLERPTSGVAGFALRPPKWSDPSQASVLTCLDLDFCAIGPPRPTAQLRPGVADPSDSSHLMIDYGTPDPSSNGTFTVIGTLHAYLQDDGTLNWDVRKR